MIKIENVEIVGWRPAIRGMRNPKNSWERSDTLYLPQEFCDDEDDFELSKVCGGYSPVVKENDFDLMSRLSAGGPVHAKYRRMIAVYVDITAPLYWWKEFDTYKVGTVSNSCSTMHKIADKEFTLEDFSCEHLMWLTDYEKSPCLEDDFPAFEEKDGESLFWTPTNILIQTIGALNFYRQRYLETKDKKYWWQMIQLLPSSYNQRRTEMLNYEVLANIYKWRKNHKLDEWRELCKWIESLPYSELITGKENN